MSEKEMENEGLAHELDSMTLDSSADEAAVREAAARLRNITIRTDNSAVIVELQRRLKVAEDALKEALDFTCFKCPKLNDKDCKCAWSPRIHKWRDALAKASGESEVRQ